MLWMFAFISVLTLVVFNLQDWKLATSENGWTIPIFVGINRRIIRGFSIFLGILFLSMIGGWIAFGFSVATLAGFLATFAACDVWLSCKLRDFAFGSS